MIISYVFCKAGTPTYDYVKYWAFSVLTPGLTQITNTLNIYPLLQGKFISLDSFQIVISII